MIITKIYRFTDIDCPSCAAKAESYIKKIKGVQGASISFFAQKVAITAEESDFDTIYPAAVAAVKKIEPECELVFLK